jgi:hypothetical protein
MLPSICETTAQLQRPSISILRFSKNILQKIEDKKKSDRGALVVFNQLLVYFIFNPLFKGFFNYLQ